LRAPLERGAAAKKEWVIKGTVRFFESKEAREIYGKLNTPD
jgi:hypothetical protein